MDDANFESPPMIWIVSTILGGIITGFGLILGLEYFLDRLVPDSNSPVSLELNLEEEKAI